MTRGRIAQGAIAVCHIRINILPLPLNRLVAGEENLLTWIFYQHLADGLVARIQR